MFLNLKWQAVFKETWYLLSVVSVAIAHREKVAMAQVQHMWVSQVGVLIDLVWIMCCDATLGREREFSDDIMDCIRVPLSSTTILLIHLLRTGCCLRCCSSYWLCPIVAHFLIILLSGHRPGQRMRWGLVSIGSCRSRCNATLRLNFWQRASHNWSALLRPCISSLWSLFIWCPLDSLSLALPLDLGSSKGLQYVAVIESSLV